MRKGTKVLGGFYITNTAICLVPTGVHHEGDTRRIDSDSSTASSNNHSAAQHVHSRERDRDIFMTIEKD